MESRLTSILTVITSAITVAVSAYVLVGPGPAAALAVVSTVALVGWRGFPRAETAERIVGPYTLAIVLVLILSTCRYLSGYVSLLGTDLRPLLLPQFDLRAGTWFFVFVACPVSAMLLGGYYLAKNTPLGTYMAWWVGLYSIVDGLFQFRLDLSDTAAYDRLYFIGSLAALAQIGMGVLICQRLLAARRSSIPDHAPSELTPTRRNLWSVFFVALVIVYAIFIYIQSGPLPLGIIVGSMIGGLIGWRKTTALHPADPARAVPLFFLLLAFFYIHVGEEGLTGFHAAIAAISGTPWSERDFMLLIGLIGPVVWIFSVWSLWNRQPFGNFVFWFLIVGMILGEPTHHLVFPVVAMIKFGIGYAYFPGMYTALFPMIPAILALAMIVGDHRRRVAAA